MIRSEKRIGAQKNINNNVMINILIFISFICVISVRPGHDHFRSITEQVYRYHQYPSRYFRTLRKNMPPDRIAVHLRKYILLAFLSRGSFPTTFPV